MIRVLTSSELVMIPDPKTHITEHEKLHAQGRGLESTGRLEGVGLRVSESHLLRVGNDALGHLPEVPLQLLFLHLHPPQRQPLHSRYRSYTVLEPGAE